MSRHSSCKHRSRSSSKWSPTSNRSCSPPRHSWLRWCSTHSSKHRHNRQTWRAERERRLLHVPFSVVNRRTLYKQRGRSEKRLSCTRTAQYSPAEMDDVPALSAETLATLQEFLQEQALRRMQEEQLLAQATSGVAAEQERFEEDWNLSQFWVRTRWRVSAFRLTTSKYTDETADAVAQECIERANGGRIACLSTPSLFRALKVSLLVTCLDGRSPSMQRAKPQNEFFLLEYDTRFQVSVLCSARNEASSSACAPRSVAQTSTHQQHVAHFRCMASSLSSMTTTSPRISLPPFTIHVMSLCLIPPSCQKSA